MMFDLSIDLYRVLEKIGPDIISKRPDWNPIPETADVGKPVEVVLTSIPSAPRPTLEDIHQGDKHYFERQRKRKVGVRRKCAYREELMTSLLDDMDMVGDVGVKQLFIEPKQAQQKTSEQPPTRPVSEAPSVTSDGQTDSTGNTVNLFEYMLDQMALQ